MNDSKYVRLYPERAVAPLRAATTVLLEMLSGERSAADRSHYIELARLALADLDLLGFPPDEPLFVLRGQDMLAAEAVRYYADLIDVPGVGLDVDHIRAFAERMAAWQPRKLPD